MKNNKIIKIYSILLLISILIAGLSNGFTFAKEGPQTNFAESCGGEAISVGEIFKYFDKLDIYPSKDLEDAFKNIKPKSYEEFEKLFKEKFKQITRQTTNKKIDVARKFLADWNFYRENLETFFARDSIPSSFWYMIFLPCVKNICFDNFNYNDNSENCKNQKSKSVQICVNNIYFLVDLKNKTATVLGRENKLDSSINIPEFFMYNGTIYRVTGLGEKAFYGDKNLEKISFEGNINFDDEELADSIKIVDMNKGTGQRHVYKLRYEKNSGYKPFGRAPWACYNFKL